MKRIYLIDCPGIVPPSLSDEPEEVLLRGSVRVENVEEPAQYVGAVLRRCKRRHLERTYELTWGSGEEGAGDVASGPAGEERKEEATLFLEALAKKGGRLLKGGEPDLDGVEKMVLNDFLRGKIPWFVSPPVAVEGEAEKSGEGRDGLLGFTHGKRKRELELEGEAEGTDGDGEDGFEGFDEVVGEEDSDEESEEGGGVEIADGEREDEESDH